MKVLQLLPDEKSYSIIEPSNRMAQTKMEGGAYRTRVDQIEPWKEVTVEWNVDRSMYLYLTSFYETSIDKGSNPFQLDLITDHPVPQTHQCVFLKGSRGLGKVKGHLYTFVGRLAVKPLTVDDELNRIRVARFEEDPKTDLLNLVIRQIAAIDHQYDEPVLKINDVVDIDLSVLFENLDELTVSYSLDSLPPGTALNSQTGHLTGTITAPTGDIPATLTGTTREGPVQSEPILWRIRPTNYVGIGEMIIGTTFVVG